MDDSQWLTYWLLSAIITIVERFAGRFLFALPLFAEFKLAFLAWLVVPPFCGAAALYEVGRPRMCATLCLQVCVCSYVCKHVCNCAARVCLDPARSHAFFRAPQWVCYVLLPRL